MNYFKKDVVISGGTKAHPYFKEIGEYKCKICNIDAINISYQNRSSWETTDRGVLRGYWEEVNIECPKCKKQEMYHKGYHESDDIYYSNEERRAFNI